MNALLGQRVILSREWNRGKRKDGLLVMEAPFPRIDSSHSFQPIHGRDVTTTVKFNDIHTHDVRCPNTTFTHHG